MTGRRGWIAAPLGALMLFTMSVGCAAPPTTDAISRPGMSSTAGAASAPPTASSPALPSASSVAVTKPAPRSTTPGKVQCAAVDCDLASEICCVEKGVGRCSSKASAKAEDPCGAGASERRCDEQADCSAGESCCRALDCASGGSPCMPPESDEGCAVHQTCVPSAACFSGDRACLPGSNCANGPCDEGHCRAEMPSLACGDATCAPGKKCCWDPIAHKGSCGCDESAAGPGFGHLAVFACERPSDCGGGYGCFSSTGVPNYQSYTCGRVETSCTRVVDSPYLCDVVANCPPLIVGDTSTGALTSVGPNGCRHDPADPPSVKRCTYP